MKNWHKLLAVVLLISIGGLTGCKANTETGRPTENMITISAAALPVVLRERAEVIPRKGTAKEGQLSHIDAEKLILTVAGTEIPIAIKDVTQVKFTGDVRFYSNGNLVIRGDGEINSQPEVWSQIPLTAFHIKQSSTGEATVNLTVSALEKSKQEGIIIVATTANYVVEQMQFEPEGKITLTVKPVLK